MVDLCITSQQIGPKSPVFKKIFVEGKVSGIVGPPKVAFMLNNPDSLRMSMEMTNAIYAIRVVNGDTGEILTNETKVLDYPIPIQTYNSISIIQGNVTSQKKIVVDLQSSNVNVDVDLPEGEEQLIEMLLTEKFHELADESLELSIFILQLHLMFFNLVDLDLLLEVSMKQAN